MSKLAALQSAETLVDVADLLDTPTSTLIHTLYKLPEASKYTTFDIPKKSGGVRTIHAPVGKLKVYQRVLADILYECADEIDAASPRRPLSHGFRRGRSIVTNASQHKKRRFVLNLDLENFFPTFHFGRVRGFFIKDQGFALKPGCATILAQLACFQGSLPQGSPCSPIIADLIAHVLDLRLVRFAKQHRVTYSRYADDLTFSTNAKAFPTALATGGTSPSDPWILAATLVDRITSTGFTVNAAKTRMHVSSSRQTVTGLTVNEKVNISQAYWRGARSMCHALFQTGTYHRHAAMPGDASIPIMEMHTLRGILAHIRHVKNVSSIKPDPVTKVL
ncbi:MAG: reverse transcriptase domain-containing protein, partial [Anaerolineales bacterium]